MLELLMSEWEELIDNPEYEPVREGLQAGVMLLEKYYRRTDDTDVYFIAHGKIIEYYLLFIWYIYDMLLVLDPVLKLQYLNVAWDKKYLTAGVESFKAQVS